MNKAELMNKADMILEEKGKQYGSFRSNIRLINIIKSGAYVEIDRDVFTDKDFYRDFWCIQEATNFTIYMLSLKIARSIIATDEEVIADCVNDFINYKNLLRDNYGVIVKFGDICIDSTRYHFKKVVNERYIIDDSDSVSCLIKIPEEVREKLRNGLLD